MKAVIINNQIQFIETLPKVWEEKEVYQVVKPPIRPDQKYGEVSNTHINQETKTITIPVIDLTSKEYNEKLVVEGGKLLEELKYLVYDLEEGAKKISIGKDGSKEYIEAQERIYHKKYLIAKGSLPDFNDLLETEAQEQGYTYEEYKDLIISKWEEGNTLFSSFSMMIDRARIKVIDFVEAKKNHKAKVIIDFMKQIKIDTPITEIQVIMNNILNI